MISYVLVVITTVYGGSQVTFQEFNTIESCQAVAKKVEDKAAFGSYNRQAFCAEK